jgi:hypothetical protein
VFGIYTAVLLLREKFRRYVDLGVVDQYLELLRRDAAMAADPAEPPPIRSPGSVAGLAEWGV